MNDKTPSAEAQKRRTGRSPAYPFISVKKAIEQAAALHEQEGEYAAPLVSAMKAWGYSPKSSGGRQTLATLKYYGLIDVSGEGDERKIKVSDVARRIILDQREDDSEKRALIRRVALSPSAHKALHDQYPNGLGSDGSAEHFLVFEQGFKPDAAKELLNEFKETASYASLYQPGNVLDKTKKENHSDSDKSDTQKVQVGDKVQWTSQGVDQFPDGAIVLGFSDDGLWLFTDGNSGAVSINEVTIMEKQISTHTGVTPPSPPPHVAEALAAAAKAKSAIDQLSVKPGSRKAVFPVEDGDVTLIFPEEISKDGLEELGQYLDIFLKKEQKKSEV